MFPSLPFNGIANVKRKRNPSFGYRRLHNLADLAITTPIQPRTPRFKVEEAI